jgi:TRAP-type C4-dicarboxylate transport system permease small subunit
MAIIYKIAQRLTKILVAFGAASLAAMMFLTAVDVALRYVFNRPIPGSYELVEYMMAVFVPFSVVYASYYRQHVSVDLLINRFPKKVQAISGIFTNFLNLVLVTLIAWQSIISIGQMYESGKTSAVYEIPLYPFVAVLALGMGVFTFLLLLHLLESGIGVKKNESH